MLAWMCFKCPVLIREKTRSALHLGRFEVVRIRQRKRIVVGWLGRALPLSRGCGKGVERVGVHGVREFPAFRTKICHPFKSAVTIRLPYVNRCVRKTPFHFKRDA